MWLVSSLAVTSFAYLFLYSKEISNVFNEAPRTIQGMNVARFGAFSRKWLKNAFYASLAATIVAIVLAWFAGFGVGLWKLFTSNLSTGVKVGVAVPVALTWLLLTGSCVYFHPGVLIKVRAEEDDEDIVMVGTHRARSTRRGSRVVLNRRDPALVPVFASKQSEPVRITVLPAGSSEDGVTAVV